MPALSLLQQVHHGRNRPHTLDFHASETRLLRVWSYVGDGVSLHSCRGHRIKVSALDLHFHGSGMESVALGLGRNVLMLVRYGWNAGRRILPFFGVTRRRHYAS